MARLMSSTDLSQSFMAMRPALLRFARARGASMETAEDILQDLFLRLRTLNGAAIAEPTAYLYRMTDNLLLDYRRSATRRSLREQAWIEAQGDRLDVDRRPSADQSLIDRERLAEVASALAALPERTSSVFRQFRIEGRSQRDVAADMGISLSAVEKHLQRAYRALVDARAKLDAAFDPSDRHHGSSNRAADGG